MKLDKGRSCVAFILLGFMTSLTGDPAFFRGGLILYLVSLCIVSENKRKPWPKDPETRIKTPD